MAACGGGGGDSGSSSSSSNSNGANQVTVTVSNATGVVNLPMVSVTVCAPGSTSNCQTINNIQVDTMSYGLRIVNTAMSQVLGSLAVTTDGSGNQIAECTVFADGYTWGSVRKADVTIGGKTAGSVPVAVIGDMSSSTVPTVCANTGTAENTVSALGANGILGIGVSPYDCGSSCVNSASGSPYFKCPGGTSCTQTTVALADQVTNPVVKFSSDNNGILLTMPAVSSSGATSATGTMTFGIGTQSNNVLSASQKFGTDSGGNVNGSFNSAALTAAFFDSGSNGYFFEDNSLTTCSQSGYTSWYCPASATTRTVSVSNASGAAASGTVTLPIQSAFTLFNSGNFAFNDLAGHIGLTGYFDVGMPFFYGRTVYFGYDMTQVGGSQTPYVAF
ncbi:DUF3443 domain-containing protein [Trinickia caryophylli]|nr:DUF3443 domain-containing protein [Trinickia caryophylli]TRX20330.1 DUF3443 domain-containing protein [Trinickia caryophylli]